MSYVHVKKTSAYIHAAKMMEMVTSQFELTSKKPGGNLKKIIIIATKYKVVISCGQMKYFVKEITAGKSLAVYLVSLTSIFSSQEPQ